MNHSLEIGLWKFGKREESWYCKSNSRNWLWYTAKGFRKTFGSLAYSMTRKNIKSIFLIMKFKPYLGEVRFSLEIWMVTVFFRWAMQFNLLSSRKENFFREKTKQMLQIAKIKNEQWNAKEKSGDFSFFCKNSFSWGKWN